MDQKLITDTDINIDMEEGVPVPLNLSIADFREPNKRQRTFSKEIKLPGTANNMQFFATAFRLRKIGGAYDFNSSQKVNVRYYKRGNLIFPNAVIRLKKVVIVDEKVEFITELFSDFVDVFLILSNIDVRELDWSAYDHVLNNTNIINSFSAPAGTGYYYALIERNQRTTISGWRNTDMIPYAYAVEVFKKCMEYAGQTYSSAFLNSTRAKNILFGYGGGNYVDAAVSPAEINNRKVILNNGQINWTESRNIVDDGSGNPQVDGMVSFNTLFLNIPIWTAAGGIPPLTFNEVQDINNQWNLDFIAGRTGTYKITLNGSIRFQYTGNFTYDSGGVRQFWYVKNNVFQPPLNVFNQSSDDDTFTISHTFNIQLNQGDTIRFILQGAGVRFTAGDVNTAITETITTPTPWTLNIECQDTTLIEGSTVQLGRMLPSMKCSDFVIGFLNHFRLMVKDPDLYNSVVIKPEIDFYQGTNVFTDISDEVDHTREIQIRPSANEFAKTLTWKLKPGTETDAKYYSNKWLEGYGDLSFDQPSFFAKGEQKIELPWATIIPYEIYPNVVIPRFVDIDANTGTKKTTAGVPRLMMRNGLKQGVWQLVQNSGAQNLTQYPCVHHFDNKDNPTFDLNFKLPQELYYSTTIWTTKNSYSEYYETFINEIISAEGKYVVLYRKMNSLMIEQLDWSKLLMWNGALFRFNKIVDFDSEITEVTKIEMLKIIEPRSSYRGQIKVKGNAKPVGGLVKGGRGVVGSGVEPVLVLGGKNQVLTTSNLTRG